MSSNILGRLERVDLRTTWQSEATEFTPWLAEADNLAILGETIGRELELEGQERNVGPFRADILCKDVESGQWVLVENQLERTDHLHLGQLLTYASGLQAVTIVWIAARFTEEHRATLDWLNEITDDRFEFFGLEVELWRIGESPPAPKFNIVSKPNDWSRDVNQAAKRIETEALTEMKQKQLAFWTMFREYLQNKGSPIRAQKPFPQHWANYRIGRSGFVLEATLNSRENRIGVGLYINSEDPKGHFNRLLQQKPSVEADFEDGLEWLELPERKGAAIRFYRNDIDPLDEANWSSIAEWFRKHLERFDAVFRQRIRNFNSEPQSVSKSLAEGSVSS